MDKPAYLDERELLMAFDRVGSYFWNKDNVRMFRSRLCGVAVLKSDSCYYFVTSERYVSIYGNEPRKYTVRKWNGIDKCVDDIGGFQAYSTARTAQKAIEKIA